MYSFRNYSIPGAGGPSPMVAAFWDDLKTGSGGYVHYYETDDKVIIQWDDMRTYDNNGSYRETFEMILYNKEYFAEQVRRETACTGHCPEGELTESKLAYNILKTLVIGWPYPTFFSNLVCLRGAVGIGFIALRSRTRPLRASFFNSGFINHS